jgi:RIO-like serine/threonine protein kinase
MSQKIKMVKSDAVIPINIGAGFMQKLTSVLISLADQQTEEEMLLLQKLMNEGKELPEPWMENIFTLIVLLKDIEMSAEKNGFTYEKTLDEIDTDDVTTQ